MTVSGQAMKMKIELAAMLSKHGITPRPFTPLPLLTRDRDGSVEGYASPTTVDREFMKFGPHCWMPFRKQNIPLLYRHQPDRPVGEIIDLEARENGLFVRARVTDPDAKRCPYFSVAATIHGYQIREADPHKHALVTCARLDEISLVPDNPGNPDAIVRPTPAVVQSYVLMADWVKVLIKYVEVLQKLPPPPTLERTTSGCIPRPMLERTNQRLLSNPRTRPPVEPHRATPFGALVSAIERNHHVAS